MLDRAAQLYLLASGGRFAHDTLRDYAAGPRRCVCPPALGNREVPAALPILPVEEDPTAAWLGSVEWLLSPFT